MKCSTLNPPTRSAGFCVYPWIEQVVQATGKMSYCCVAKDGGVLKKESGEAFKVLNDRLGDAWNSAEMRSIRQDMLNGTPIPACSLCHYQESIGKRSYREMHNEEWMNKCGPEIEKRIASSIENAYVVDQPPMYLDLRLGNKCNLKCRSCNGYNSNQIARESVDIGARDNEFLDLMQRHGTSLGREVDLTSWAEDPRFWEEITTAIPHLRKVYLTGGEPTLIRQNFEFMQACIDKDHSKDIFLMFNTNGMNIHRRFLSLLESFGFVLINLSLDGVGAVNDYLRYGSNWEHIVRNIRKIMSAKGNIQIGITPVVQTYNILDIAALLDFAEDLGNEFGRTINVDFLYATTPAYLNPTILPTAMKAQAAERLEEFKLRSKTYGQERFLSNSVDSCLRILRESPEGHSAKLLRDLCSYTRILDRERGQDVSLLFPELTRSFAALERAI